MLVYLLTNDVNGKIYVGQTIQTLEKRISEHKNNSNNPNSNSYNTHLSKAIRMHGWDNFKVEVIKILPNQKQLDDTERLCITFFDSTNRENGYNIKENGNLGKKRSDETKLKMSIAQTGRVVSDETKKKMSEAQSGEKHYNWCGKCSDETKALISKATSGEKNHNFGKKASDETKVLLSKAKSGENHPMFGKKLSDEHKEKISKANKGNSSPSVDKKTVELIRYDHDNGMKRRELVAKYNIPKHTIYRIVNHQGSYRFRLSSIIDLAIKEIDCNKSKISDETKKEILKIITGNKYFDEAKIDKC